MVHVLKDVENLLGTFVTITVVHPDIDGGISALRAAFAEIRRIQGLMSVHRQDSEVAILNRIGFCDGLSDDTTFVVQGANDFSELSGGAFDITVFPILELWREKTRAGEVPTDEEIRERLGLVNYRGVVVRNGSIHFGKPGMGITLAAVAKGYAVDKAIEVLRRAHIKHGLVNAGGDIRCLGGKTETLPWRVAIRDPRNKDRVITTLELYDQAIATSGPYQRPFHDIIHPKSGRPCRGVLSATALAGSAMEADLLATWMVVAGAETGYESDGHFAEKGFIVKEDGTILNRLRPWKENRATYH
jgi:FAD:protein FMN transferase